MATNSGTLPMIQIPNTKLWVTVIGLAAWLHNTYVISIPPTGKAGLYCQTHAIFFDLNKTCPECQTHITEQVKQ
jgi:hypothetical protein